MKTNTMYYFEEMFSFGITFNLDYTGQLHINILLSDSNAILMDLSLKQTNCTAIRIYKINNG